MHRPATPPGARATPAMALLPGTPDKLLLYGGAAGATLLSDAHAFDGAEWAPVSTLFDPGARSGHGMVTDGTGVLMAGGRSSGAEELPAAASPSSR